MFALNRLEGSPRADSQLAHPLCRPAPAPAGWLCVPPECPLHDSLPLWRMLSGSLPGFVRHGELLFRVSAAALSRAEAEAAEAYDDEEEEGGEAERVEDLEAAPAALAACAPPAPGPLGPQPRLLSSRVLQAGHQWACPRLWGSRGFASHRLPGTSGAATVRQLQAAQARRLAATPEAEDVMQGLLGALEARAYSAVRDWVLPQVPRALDSVILALLGSQMAGGLLYLLWSCGECAAGRALLSESQGGPAHAVCGCT